MSEIKVNKISPRTACGTTTLGDSGDTFTIPAGVTITNNGTQTGFGREGSVNWQTTIKTATFTAANGEGYFCNTSGGAFTVNLPSASVGNIVAIKDYAGTFQTNNLTITPNGSDKIDGINGNATISTENAAIVLVFADSTRGWLNANDSTNVEGAAFITATGGTITTCGNFKIHTFTSPGTFCVSAGAGPLAVVDYLVVAGGAGGGGNDGGGGGAGGYRESSGAASGCYTTSPLGSCVSALPVTAQGYPIAVGGGGSAGNNNTDGGDGSNSVFSTITSTGGGGGAAEDSPAAGGPANRKGEDGGSGGGGGQGGGGVGPGGSGNTPPVSPPQGNDGGDSTGSYPVTPSSRGGGGGGGAGAAGSNNSTGTAGNGGAGVTSCITGSPVARAGGGGGGGRSSGGSGGTGGGGAGSDTSATATAGTTNTGGGGGGAGEGSPGCRAAGGGSGIVIIRYKFQ